MRTNFGPFTIFERLVGGLDCLIDVSFVALRYKTQDLLVCRIDSLEGFPRFGSHPLAANKQLFRLPEEPQHRARGNTVSSLFD
jgi:hypothetical protein